MQVHPNEKTKRKDFIHTTIDKLSEARKRRCMVWGRLHGYFKDSLTLCYNIQSTKIAIICITAFLVWLSCFLISHQWDWAWCTSNQIWYFWAWCTSNQIWYFWAWCTSNQIWYFWLFCSPRPHISLPVWIKRHA